MVTIPVNSQKQPVEYLARRFLINHNLTTMAKLVKGDVHRNPPIIPADDALALAAFALLKLRTAQLAKLDADGTDWDDYIADAEALADFALASVSASNNGYFPSAQRIVAKLQKFAADNNQSTIPDPSDLADDWATNRGAQPVAAPLNYSIANDAAFNINLLSGVTNAENTTETLSVLSVDGKNWELDREVVIGGVTFTMAPNFALTAPAFGANITFSFVAVITDGVTAPVNRTINVTTTTP
jgi:hypothetical protein